MRKRSSKAGSQDDGNRNGSVNESFCVAPVIPGAIVRKLLHESARWLVYHAAWLMEKQGASPASAAKVRLVTGEMLKRATDTVTMIYSGPGPAPEIEIQRYVHSVVPMDALDYGLECARVIIATDLLAGSEGG